MVNCGMVQRHDDSSAAPGRPKNRCSGSCGPNGGHETSCGATGKTPDTRRAGSAEQPSQGDLWSCLVSFVVTNLPDPQRGQ